MLKGQKRTPTAEEMEEVERLLGRPLPPQYRNFIQRYNGGEPHKHIYPISDGESIYFQYLFPIGNVQPNLAEEMLRPNLPEKLISIGLLGDGGRLCLNIENDGIYCWNYDSVEEDGEISERNVIALEVSIADFFENLEPGLVDLVDENLSDEADEVAELASSGDILRLEEYVSTGGNLSSAKDGFGRSILEAAVGGEDIPFLDACLRLGSPVCEALHAAAEVNAPDVIEWLIEKGADINALNSKGETPLDLADEGSGAKLMLKTYGAKPGVDIRGNP